MRWPANRPSALPVISWSEYVFISINVPDRGQKLTTGMLRRGLYQFSDLASVPTRSIVRTLTLKAASPAKCLVNACASILIMQWVHYITDEPLPDAGAETQTFCLQSGATKKCEPLRFALPVKRWIC